MSFAVFLGVRPDVISAVPFCNCRMRQYGISQNSHIRPAYRRCIRFAPSLAFCLNVPGVTAVAIVAAAATLNGKRFNAIIYHFSHNNRSARSAHTAFGAQEREVKQIFCALEMHRWGAANRWSRGSVAERKKRKVKFSLHILQKDSNDCFSRRIFTFISICEMRFLFRAHSCSLWLHATVVESHLAHNGSAIYKICFIL